MIIKCRPNRVERTYLGGQRIDRLRGISAENGYKPEEWICSVTSARNAGSTGANEGLSLAEGGRTLLSILEKNPEYLGGYDRLPILLKLLDSAERLVIQAHPTAEYARRHLNSAFGKAECWYIISADTDAHVYLGFREGVTRKDWKDAFDRQDIDKMLSMLHRISLKEGDVWYVDGGVPHAIGGGCLMAELQEPTDLMVVPERRTPSGRILAEQRLHCGLGFEKMFDVFSYAGFTRDELESKFHAGVSACENRRCTVIGAQLTDKFRMDEYRVNGCMEIFTEHKPAAAVAIDGEGVISDTESGAALKPGDGFFISASSEKLLVKGKIRILTAYP